VVLGHRSRHFGSQLLVNFFVPSVFQFQHLIALRPPVFCGICQQARFAQEFSSAFMKLSYQQYNYPPKSTLSIITAFHSSQAISPGGGHEWLRHHGLYCLFLFQNHYYPEHVSIITILLDVATIFSNQFSQRIAADGRAI